LSSFPLLRPLRKMVAELLELISGSQEEKAEVLV